MITVLIPLYNGVEFLEEAVQSIIAQTYADWTLLVGVNGWPAGSEVYHHALRICSSEPRAQVVDLPHVRGKSATLNAMVSLTQASWVALLDADDVWHPRKLELQRPWMSSYDVIGTQCVYIGDRAGTIPYIPLNDITTFDFLQVNPIINSSVLLRKEFAHWNENNVIGLEDYELWLTLKGRRFFNVPSVLVQHRLYVSSSFNNTNHLHVEELKQRFK